MASTRIQRREFLRRLGHYSVAGSAARWAVPLSMMAEAAAQTASDYKAIVCVYLYGGNDYANTLIPYDTASYNQYSTLRPSIALARSALAATALSPTSALPGGLQFALEPGLAPLVPIFNAGQLGVLLNLGTLVVPTTRAQYLASSVPLPPKLFSHIDQQNFWHMLAGSGSIDTGWGGRVEDVLMSANGNSTFSCISASGNAVFLTGNTALQYQVGTSGATAITGLSGSLFGSSAATAALRTLITTPTGRLLQDQVTNTVNRSIAAQSVLASAIGTTSQFGTLFPGGNTLASQLQVVARLIAARQALGAKRQVFFVSLGGFDTHDNITAAHPVLMKSLGDALGAFHAALVQIGALNQVTAFTASDFGRTLTSNGDGSDHGWGSHHFVMGGAVSGGRFYGTAPALANNGPDDVGQGRLVPTMAIDQLAASLGGWLGASATQLTDTLPNLRNFSSRAVPLFA